MSTTYSIPSTFPSITTNLHNYTIPATTTSTLSYTRPNFLELSNNGKTVVRIHFDGSIEYGENVTADEAAKEFWDKIGPTRHALNEEIRLRDKYPALMSAWEHYQIVLKMCQSEDQNGVED